jgi:diacylglycerol kinase
MSERAMAIDPREEVSPTARKANFGQTFRAVAWSFLGIRRSADHEQDVRKLNPIHVVIAAVLGAAVFVVFLVVLVHFVIGAATSH